MVTDAVLSALQQSDCRNIELGERHDRAIRSASNTSVRWSPSTPTEPWATSWPPCTPPPLSAAHHEWLRSRSSTAMKATTGPTIPGGSDWRMATIAYFVNLRCGCLEGHRLSAYAGGGITAGSDPDVGMAGNPQQIAVCIDPIVHWPNEPLLFLLMPAPHGGSSWRGWPARDWPSGRIELGDHATPPSCRLSRRRAFPCVIALDERAAAHHALGMALA